MDCLTNFILSKINQPSGGGGVTPTGTINITSNGTHDVTDYAEANVNVVSTNNAKVKIQVPAMVGNMTISSAIEELPEMDLTSTTTGANMFLCCTNLKVVSLKNTSGITSANKMFSQCDELVNVPTFDTTNVSDMGDMFSYCTKIVTVPEFNTANVTTMANMFYRCTSLTTIPAFNTSKVTTMKKMFNNAGFYSPLTNDSLNNVLAMCKNATLYAQTKTLKDVGLTSDQASTCTTLSNWADCVSAGWSTGY